MGAELPRARIFWDRGPLVWERAGQPGPAASADFLQDQKTSLPRQLGASLPISAWGGKRGGQKTCHHVSPENVPGECRATQVGPRGCGSTGGLPGHCGCQTGDVPIRYTHPLSLSSTTASSLHTTAAPLWCLSSLGGSSGLGLLTSTASSALRTGGYCVKSNAARANNLER